MNYNEGLIFRDEEKDEIKRKIDYTKYKIQRGKLDYDDWRDPLKREYEAYKQKKGKLDYNTWYEQRMKIKEREMLFKKQEAEKKLYNMISNGDINAMNSYYMMMGVNNNMNNLQNNPNMSAYKEALLYMNEEQLFEMNSFINAYLEHYNLPNNIECINEAFYIFMNEGFIKDLFKNPEEREQIKKQKEYDRYIKKGGKLDKETWSDPYQRKYEYYKQYGGKLSFKDYVKHEKAKEQEEYIQNVRNAEVAAIQARAERDRETANYNRHRRYQSYSRALKALKENLNEFPEEKIKTAYTRYINAPIKIKKPMNYKEFKAYYIKSRTSEKQREDVIKKQAQFYTYAKALKK